MTFEIWHAKTPGNFFGDKDFAQKFPSGYDHVADVECVDQHAVFQSTNHIDGNWLANPNVRPVASSARSTSVGDIMVRKEDGKRIMFDWIGYWELP